MNASYIILVESGATKSEWRVLERGGKEVKRFFRAGMNVSTMRMEDVQATLAEAVGREGLMNAGGFYLYTAGIVTPEVRRMVEGLLREHFRIGDVDIQNDLTGAARAACGHEPGIAAILGTGSNTCFYDGELLTQKVYSGGYVIGDEGSGASLGKRFLADYIKGLVPEPLATDFAREFDASYASIVQGVYRSASPSGYLGSLAPMILRHYDHPYAKDLVDRNFQDFIDRSLLRVGGFGWACRDILRPLCEKAGIRISRFIQAPIEGLCAYHTE